MTRNNSSVLFLVITNNSRVLKMKTNKPTAGEPSRSITMGSIPSLFQSQQNDGIDSKMLFSLPGCARTLT